MTLDLTLPLPSDSIETPPQSKLKKLKNGAIYDMDKKKIVANPGGGKHAITSERAREFAVLKRERKQQTILDTMNKTAKLEAKGAQVNPAVRRLIGTDDQAGLRAVTWGRTRAAMDSDSPYGNAAADWLTENAGLKEPKQTERTTGEAAMQSVGEALLSAILRRRLADGDVVEGHIHEVESGQDDETD